MKQKSDAIKRKNTTLDTKILISKIQGLADIRFIEEFFQELEQKRQ